MTDTNSSTIHDLSNIADIINDAITSSQNTDEIVRCEVPDIRKGMLACPVGTQYVTRSDGSVSASMDRHGEHVWRIVIAHGASSSITSNDDHEQSDGREDINDALEEAIGFADENRDTLDSVESAMACLGTVETLSDAAANLEEIIDGLQIMLKEAKSLHKKLKRSGS